MDKQKTDHEQQMSGEPDWFRSLDIKGWRGVLYIEDKTDIGPWPHLCEAVLVHRNSPLVLRIEQWILSGAQYLYIERNAGGAWGPVRLGEASYAMNCQDGSDKEVLSLEELRAEVQAYWQLPSVLLEEVHPALRHVIVERI